MKLLLDDKKQVMVRNDKPVYVDDGGKEIEFDAPHALTTIGRLNAEAKTHREAKEIAEQKLRSFDGMDSEAARKALKTVENLDHKKLVDAGEVEKVKEAAIKSIVAERDNLRTALHNEMIGGSFARSKFVSEKMVIPHDLVRSHFERYFRIKDGAVIGVDRNGNDLFSRSRPGALADFDDALEQLVDQYASRDHILKGKTGAGSGTSGGGAGGGNAKTMTRAQFEAATPMERMKFSKDGGKVVDI